MSTQIVDDKSEHCIPFILKALERHQQSYAALEEVPIFFIGLNGVQGAGKTTLVGLPEGFSSFVALLENLACKPNASM